jgi:hypothetical protein
MLIQCSQYQQYIQYILQYHPSTYMPAEEEVDDEELPPLID